MPVPTPVPFFPSADISNSYVATQEQAIGGASQICGPFCWTDGNLYSVMIKFQPNGPAAVSVYQSTDGGATWHILDAAHQPGRAATQGISPDLIASFSFDGVHTITVAYFTGADSPSTAPVALRDFNLTTGLWGSDYGTAGAPVTALLNQLIRRLDGSLLLITSTGTGNLVGNVYASGSWSSFNLAASLTETTNSSSSCVLDPATGIIHMFGLQKNFSLVGQVYYQQIQTDNSITNFQTFVNSPPAFNPTVAGKGQVLGFNMGNPVIYNGKLVLGVVLPDGSGPSVLIGSPLSAPSFTLLATTIDPSNTLAPDTPTSSNLMPAATLATDGSTVLYSVTCGTDTTFTSQQIRLQKTTNPDPSLGWSGSLIFSDSGTLWNTSVGDVVYPTLGLCGSKVLITVQAVAASLPPSSVANAYFTFLGGSPPPVVTGSPGILGGGAGAAGSAAGGALGGVAGAQGRFKCCVNAHRVQWARMADVVRRMERNRAAWPYRYEFAPPESIEVNLIKTANSAAVGVLLAVLSYTVPLGMRFFLEGILQDFAGAAFAPGSALWTVDRNASPANTQGTYVQGLIQAPVPYGSFTDRHQWRFYRAYEFGPNETIRSTVVNQSLGVGAPNVFISGFFGYLVPTYGL